MSISIRQYEKILWTARLTSLTVPVLAVVYSFAIGLAASKFNIPVGSFQGGSIVLFPILIGFALLGWKWPLLAGILMLAIGVFIAIAIQTASGWPGWYKIPYWVFEGMYLASGILYLFVAYFNRR